eukprot:4734602-Pyramimonas_sp.AAC.1
MLAQGERWAKRTFSYLNPLQRNWAPQWHRKGSEQETGASRRRRTLPASIATTVREAPPQTSRAPGRTAMCVNDWQRRGLQGGTSDSAAVGCAVGAGWRASESRVLAPPQETRCANSLPTFGIACPAGPQLSV